MPSLTSNLVNPRQRREKGKEKPSPPPRTWPTDTLAKFHFYILFAALSSFFFPFSTTLLGYRDRWWLPRERNPLRIEKTTQPSTSLSLSLSLSRPRSKLLTFYHARSSTRATTRCTLDRNVNRIRGLLFPVPRKIHFPSEEGSAPPHPRLIFSFRFTRVLLAFDMAKRRRLIASINDDTFYRGFSPLPLPPNTRHSETVFMDLYRSTWYVARK